MTAVPSAPSTSPSMSPTTPKGIAPASLSRLWTPSACAWPRPASPASSSGFNSKPGLGLLHAHGLLDGVRARLVTGQQLHPTIDPAVTAAILDGHTSAMRDSRGRELKPQFFPHQLVDWLGLHLARSATATALLFPCIDPDREPSIAPESRSITSTDFFDPDGDDRYPRLSAPRPDHS
ncbi:MAG: hypothetical protein ACRDSL_08085 [Pseudonocardiaceae bacterium]